MDPSRWKAVNRIFHAALDMPASDREPFVVAESNGDLDLQSEIERLLQADTAADSHYLESPLIEGSAPHGLQPSEPVLQPGTLLSGRFSILRIVGEGGMGQVYEARDQELGVSVALKVIRPEIASHSEAVARFRQEVRLARRVTHPNICRIYDLNRDVMVRPDGSSGELLYLTMEFLGGETIAERIRRAGPISPGEGLEIARQMAEGLDAAHNLGVIHRDIKPANVHLVSGTRGSQAGTRVVITDFGLARLDSVQMESELSSPTSFARPIGTLGYMAPEQLENGSVSAATDIYSFGLVLFEMITGTRAFPSSSLLSGVAQRLNGKIPSPQAVVAEVPAAWEGAIQGCLRLDPEERFRKAADVIGVLEGSRPHLSPSKAESNTSSGPRAERKSWRSPWLALPVAICVLLSLIAAGYRYYQWKAKSSVTAGALVYLAPVRNTTGDRSLDNLTELIQAGLTQSAHINLLDQSRVGDVLQKMTKAPDTPINGPIAREIAMRGGAVRVVFPTVSGEGEDLQLDVDIQQPDNTPSRYRNHWTHSFAWQRPQSASRTIPPELLLAVRNASDWIRHEAGESSNDIARLDVPPEDATTPSWEALQDYVEAHRLLTTGKKDAAIDMLRSATRSDPHFALAWAELADNLMSEFRSAESLQAYERATALEQDGRLTPRERYFIVASRASDTNDFEAAAETFKSYTDLYPNDYLGWFYLAYPLTELGRGDEGLIALRKSLALQSRGAGTRAKIALTDLVLGQADEARAIAIQLSTESYDEGFYTRGIVDFLDGHPDAARTSFSKLQSSASQVFRAFGYQMTARVLAEQDQWAQALPVLDKGVAESHATGDQGDLSAELYDEAWVLCRLGRCSESFEVLDRAGADIMDPQRMIAASWALGLAAQSNQPEVRKQSVLRLRRLLAAARHQPPGAITEVAVHRIAGELDTALEDWGRAESELEAASRRDSVIGDRSYLGRFYRLAADRQKDDRASRDFLLRAVSAWRHTVDHPAWSWHEPWLYPPGFLADEMQACLDLCRRDPALQADCASLQNRYNMLRPDNPLQSANSTAAHPPTTSGKEPKP